MSNDFVRLSSPVIEVHVEGSGPRGKDAEVTKESINQALGYTPVKSVNDTTPDENGNIDLKTGGNVSMADNALGGVDVTVEDVTRTLATEGDLRKTETEVTSVKADLTELSSHFVKPENYDRLEDKTGETGKTFDSNGNIVAGSYLVFPMFIAVEPNTQYYVNNINYFGAVRGYDENKSIVTPNPSVSGRVLTTGANMKYIRISVNQTANPLNVSVQKGTSATPIGNISLASDVDVNIKANSIKNNALIESWKNNQRLYPHSYADNIKYEEDLSNAYISWTGNILARGYYSNGWYLNEARPVVGSDYAVISPSGLECIKIPFGYMFILDMSDSTQRLKVIPISDYDADKHLIMLSVEGFKTFLGELANFVLFDMAVVANDIANYINPYSDNTNMKFNEFDNRSKNTISFLWGSDTHHQIHGVNIYGVKVETLKEMASLSNELKADFLTLTGDIVNGYYPVNEQKNSLFDVVNTLRKFTDIPVMIGEGNHDDNSWYASAKGSSGTTPTGLAQVLNNEQFTNYSMNNSIENFVFDSNNPLGGYYYKDFKKSKIRVVMLNCVDIPYIENADKSLKYEGQWTFGYQEAQLKWLCDKALKFDESGWGVVFLQHCDSNMTGNEGNAKNLALLNTIVNAYINKTSGTGVSSVTDFEANIPYDFTSNSSNEVIAWFAGHTHTDANEVINGIPHITITNMFNANGGGYDIVTLNRVEKTIKCTRYNKGELADFNRVINY